MRLSPHDPRFFHAQSFTAVAHFISSRYAEALSWVEKAVRANSDDVLNNGVVAACAALAARLADAGRAVARLRQLQPQLRISDLIDLFPLRRPDDRGGGFRAYARRGCLNNDGQSGCAAGGTFTGRSFRNPLSSVTVQQR
jgi:hypothetical protein